eukprot:TRINITY_DN12520_c0_g1_i1.p1 TRINITY_DN12520_c0_g1~~TRINITY_DN12520_c0_g1_i1.p1  ORF type:complete len:384 (+),score=120.79 TRINITY_DN12520_c0_g1_i1:51-1154(+)
MAAMWAGLAACAAAGLVITEADDQKISSVAFRSSVVTVLAIERDGEPSGLSAELSTVADKYSAEVSSGSAVFIATTPALAPARTLPYLEHSQPPLAVLLPYRAKSKPRFLTDADVASHGGQRGAALREFVGAGMREAQAKRWKENDVAVMGGDDVGAVRNAGMHLLVYFHAPWCESCKDVDEMYSRLGQVFRHDADVVFGSVNADEHKGVAEEHGVEGFPSLLWFQAGGAKGELMTGDRDLDAAEEFVRAKLGRPVPADGDVVTLTRKAFEDAAAGSGKYVFVDIYSQGCFHCKHLAPVWREVADAFASDPRVQIAKIDVIKYGAVVSRHVRGGVPTIVLFGPTGAEEVYQGARTRPAIVRWLWRRL